jgi:hypothetical protein
MAKRPAMDWEKTKADKRADKSGAKKAGKSMKAYEGSKADMKADKRKGK